MQILVFESHKGDHNTNTALLTRRREGAKKSKSKKFADSLSLFFAGSREASYIHLGNKGNLEKSPKPLLATSRSFPACTNKKSIPFPFSTPSSSMASTTLTQKSSAIPANSRSWSLIFNEDPATVRLG
jgi:hypothetical protein